MKLCTCGSYIANSSIKCHGGVCMFVCRDFCSDILHLMRMNRVSESTMLMCVCYESMLYKIEFYFGEVSSIG